MPVLITIFGLLAVIAAVSGYSTQDDDSFYYGRLHDLSNFNKETRNLDGIGGGNLLRDLDLLRNRAEVLSRASRDQGENDKKQGVAYHYMDPLMGNTIGLAKRFHPYDSLRFGNGPNKREWDEIDRSSFGSFAKKNFDEIDRSGFGSFVKKNFDEIDRSGFGSFVKRSAPAPQSAPEVPQN